MENFYDMTHVSKSVVDKNKRIEQQTADYLKKYNENLKEEMEAKEAKALNEAMSGARYGYASSVARSKNRVNKLSEEIKYTNESSIIGMTEMVAEVVEKGLLLDESEFAKIYPEYKKDIRGIVKGFLKEAEINEDITNKDTLALMEYVSKTLPGVREGISLTEDDLANYIAYRKPVNIDKSIKNLSGDVASNVALLMEKEQEKNEKIDKDVKRAQAKSAKKTEKKDEAMTAEEIINGLESGKLTEEDIDAMLQNGEITQDTYDEVVNAYEEAAAGNEQPIAKKDMTTSQEAAAEEEMDPAMARQDQVPMSDPNAQMSTDSSMAGRMTTSTMAPSGMPRKQIQMLPDGTMNVNIFENFDLVKETPRCGLVESLAVNEANKMLSEGKEYDGDLCLAKAIMYVTITEAMNTMGLMTVDEKKYSEIATAAGGSFVEASSSFKKAYRNGGSDLRNYLNGKLKAEAIAMNKKSKGPNTIEKMKSTMADVVNKYEEKGKKAEKAGLNESILVNQYVPVLNNRTDSDSLAERIRRKRLNEQQTLND